jgi:hypothetical protein
MSAAARMQINLMLSKVEDIKQVVGLREMAFPLFWFEDVSCFIHENRGISTILINRICCLGYRQTAR